MSQTSRDRTRGFTLLELLIVVAILGLLASIISVPVIASRKRARDAKRIEDLQTIRDALEMYLIDHGSYPPTGCGWNCTSFYYSCVTNPASASNWNNFMAYLRPYLQSVPVDPINTPGTPPWSNTNEGYCYAYGRVMNPTVPTSLPITEHTYDLTARLETPGHPESCGKKNYRWNYNDRPWCRTFGGSYPDAIYEASIH